MMLSFSLILSLHIATLSVRWRMSLTFQPFEGIGIGIEFVKHGPFKYVLQILPNLLYALLLLRLRTGCVCVCV